MTITFRPVTAADHEFCFSVHHLSMRAYVEPLWGWDEALQDMKVLESIERRDAIHEIALATGTPIGYLSLQLKTEVLFLHELYLHPDHQGQGHGSEILSRLIGLHSARKTAELSVLTTNPRASVLRTSRLRRRDGNCGENSYAPIPRLNSLFRRHLLALGRDDFLDRTAPAVVRQIEDDAVRILVFDLVEGVRIVVGPAAKMSGARIGRLFGGFLEIVDPQAEMHQTMIALVKAGNLAVVFE